MSTTDAPASPADSAPPGAPLLEVRDLRAGYGGIDVLRGVNLEVHPGEVVALLGPNGAGKTTTLMVIAGLLEATSGDVLVAGRRINGAGPAELARCGLCLVPEGRGVFPNLTVRENLKMMTYGGRSLREIEAVAYDRFPRLADRRTQTAGTLSGGEQQMLALARGLACDPALLILDELSIGLAPLIVEELYARVAEVAADGVAILVVEQFAEVALGVAGKAAIMTHGEITHSGSPDEIRAVLPETYLGG